MKIIKRYVFRDNYGDYRCAVWTNTYAHSLSHVLMLCEYAYRHDSSVHYDDIDVMKYAGDRYKGMTAIEFNTRVRPDETWDEAHMLEYTA